MIACCRPCSGNWFPVGAENPSFASRTSFYCITTGQGHKNVVQSPAIADDRGITLGNRGPHPRLKKVPHSSNDMALKSLSHCFPGSIGMDLRAIER